MRLRISHLEQNLQEKTSELLLAQAPGRQEVYGSCTTILSKITEAEPASSINLEV